MDAAKQKISVTLDGDLLQELRGYPGSVSSQLNDALRVHLARRRSQESWTSILDELDEADGPLDSPEDLAEAARIEQVWRGLDAAAAVTTAPAAEVDDPARRAS